MSSQEPKGCCRRDRLAGLSLAAASSAAAAALQRPAARQHHASTTASCDKRLCRQRHALQGSTIFRSQAGSCRLCGACQSQHGLCISGASTLQAGSPRGVWRTSGRTRCACHQQRPSQGCAPAPGCSGSRVGQLADQGAAPPGTGWSATLTIEGPAAAAMRGGCSSSAGLGCEAVVLRPVSAVCWVSICIARLPGAFSSHWSILCVDPAVLTLRR